MNKTMSKQAKNIRKQIINYVEENKKWYLPNDNLDFEDGFNLGITIIVQLLEEVFNGIEQA